jgi:adenine specific DNA methylase Mod
VASLEIDITKEFNDVVESMKEFETESRENLLKREVKAKTRSCLSLQYSSFP